METNERWYLGAMNDGLFIINRPPSPAGTDVAPHENPNGPTVVLNVTDLSQEKAQAVVDALNAEYTRGRAEGFEAAFADPGVALIHTERMRQRNEEGFDAARDDAYTNDELSRAAACYALAEDIDAEAIDHVWPWSAAWWKPSGRIRNLAKAGALLVAEIDRLLRAGAKA